MRDGGLDPRERLAIAVRRLAVLTVTTAAGDDDLVTTASALEAAADRLAALPAHPGGARFERGDGEHLPELHRAMPFDMVVGRCNPVAPPVAITFDPPRALGSARFGATHEGAPGWVHGAAVAAAFDMVLTAANMVERVAGPTVTLTLRYRRPTLLDEECQFEAWVESMEGSRVRSHGRLTQRGRPTVEAEGVFVNLSYEDIQARSSTAEPPVA